MGIQTAAGTALGGASRLLGFWFKWKILTFFFIFLFINAVLIGIQAKSIEPAINDLGKRFITPTQVLHEEVLKIIDKGLIYEKSPNFWGGIWNLISTYWSLLTNLYIMVLWISVLGLISRHFILWDDSKKSSGWLIGFILFFGIQMLLIAVRNKGSVWDPLIMIKDFYKAIPYIISPFKNQ